IPHQNGPGTAGRLAVAMATYLDRIVAAHRERARADARPVERLLEEAREAPAPRGFSAALRTCPTRPAVVAEVKRRSPSKGDLAPDLDPAVLAKQYQAGGAACLSVLTDAAHFGGSAADLAAAREATDLPTLRKDFTVDERDVCDARLMGADAVLLIVAAIDPGELRAFSSLAYELGLDALVEVHDEREADRALDLGATLLGVNQRDLVTFEVDTERARRVASAIPADVTAVAESGITGPDQARRLVESGYTGILVGEHLVTSGDPTAAVRELVAACS
ncbi:MAG TPA: indole-3-glycerol phosphate synthase TrpC, partial [Acidimicrobiales bacterium]|nr:indole-3-glycerol phosphate synthase TrpC [Acidimicrobiales bacterium]